MEVEECYKSSEVKYVVWAPGWEEKVDENNRGHASASLTSKEKRNFTETERELHLKGIDLVIGVNESQSYVHDDLLTQLVIPVSSYSTSRFTIKRVKGSNETIQLFRDNEMSQLLLQATKLPGKESLWDITSPTHNIGCCRVYLSSKRNQFYCVFNDTEEMAVVYRKSNKKGKKYCFFEVMLPALTKDTGNRTQIAFREECYLLGHANLEVLPSDCVRLHVREPQIKDGNPVLLFNSRVKKPSKKNFVLIHQSNPSRDILLFGKSGVKQFNLDINWPLSIIQGFSICLTSFSKPKAQ